MTVTESPPLHADDRSLAERLISPLLDLPPEERAEAIAAAMAELSETDLRFLLSWEGQARPSQRIAIDGDRPFVALIGGRGSGKRLWVDTPVPTPNGWTTMGQLRPGDRIYDEAGRPCSVLWASPIEAAPAVRLRFSDGSTLLADADHQWITWTARDRKALNRSGARPAAGFPADWPTWRSSTRWGHPGEVGPRVRTTAEIVGSLLIGERGDRNHSIPTAAPLRCPPVPLPIDPWVLGAWLGDGDTRDPALTVGLEDEAATLAILTGTGTPWRESPSARRSGRAPRFWLGIRDGLKALGVLGAKHVPAMLLRGSIEQRSALLQGLMDTDGGWSGATVEFCSTNPLLAQGVVELSRSLGQKPTMAESRAVLYGQDCGPRWRVHWTPTVQVFRLPRKADRWRPTGAQQLRHHHRMIVAAEPSAVLPMRCITVDSPSSLYLAGEAMIPTHNTRGGAEGICDRIEADLLHHGGLISRTPGDVRRVMIEGESGLIACAERRGIRLVHQPSLAQIRIVGGGTITTYSAQEPDSLRGPQHDTIWGDEFAAWPRKVDAMGNNAFSNAVAGLRLGKSPLGIFTTTPRAIPEVKQILTNETGLWRASRMTTWANAANLAPGFLATLKLLYGGSRLAAQEFEGLYVEDVEGALWSTLAIEATRLVLSGTESWEDALPGGLPWAYVAVDPSVAEDGGGDECGIVAGGVGMDRRLYVTHDWSDHLAPKAWAQRSLDLARRIGARAIIAEGNNGGALVSETIGNLDPTMPVEIVHARNNKRARAEPVALLWDGDPMDLDPDLRPRASIVGSLPALEAELTGWDAEHSNVSPNRLDALAWLGHACFGHLFQGEASWSAATGSWRLPT